MKLNTTTKIELTAKEIAVIIKEHLKTKGYDCENVNFNIDRVYSDSLDSFGSMVLKSATVKANIKTETKTV